MKRRSSTNSANPSNALPAEMRMRTVIAALVLGTILVLMLIQFFYQSIQSSQSKEQMEAVLQAKSHSALVSSDLVETYIGEKVYWIVSGKDKDGNNVMVWVSKDEVHSVFVSDGISRTSLKQKILQLDPQADIVRITPGRLKEDYIWEVYYKKQENNGKRYYYGYYNFADGALIDTYRLSKVK